MAELGGIDGIVAGTSGNQAALQDTAASEFQVAIASETVAAQTGQASTGANAPEQEQPRSFVGKAQQVLQGVTHSTINGITTVAPEGTTNAILDTVQGAATAVGTGARYIFDGNSTANRVGAFTDKLGQVDTHAFTNTAGLKGDWKQLYNDWLAERSRPELGTWNDKRNSVLVTDHNYTGDLAGRQHQEALETEFLKQHPNPAVGDSLTADWRYTGPGSTGKEPYRLTQDKNGKWVGSGGPYTAVESFLGSYTTQVKCISVDPVNGQAVLQFDVTNTSHWQSATRTPENAQQLGFPQYIVSNRERGQGLGIGGNWSQDFQWTKTVNLPAPPSQ